MQTNELAYNATLAKRLNASKVRSSWHKMLLLNAAVILMLCVVIAMLLLVGCATQQQVPCEPLASPLGPALLTPLPPVSYSISAQRDIQTWQQRLTGTPATSKP
jgi:hypothetical protein